MPTNPTRINPLDLQGNIAVGVSLPFNQPSVFKSTYSTKDQIKSNLINLLLTNRGERPFNPEFGADIKRALFEGITNDLATTITDLISYSVESFMPEVNIVNINVDINTPDTNTIRITIDYNIAVSGTSDQITLEFI